jgi:hypothetical protein
MSDERQPEETPVETHDNGEGNRAEARIKELLQAKASSDARADAAEVYAQRAEQRFQDIMLERSNTPEPETEDDWGVDPAERKASEALKTAAEAKKLAESNADSYDRQIAIMAIDKAVSAHNDWLDGTDVKDRLAKEWFLARAQGRTFDAEREAGRIRNIETQALGSRRDSWAKTKAEQASATASPTSQPSPPVTDPASEIPPWNTPERAKYDRELEAEIMSDWAAGR